MLRYRMAKALTFAVSIQPMPDDEGFLANFPALPGCHASGPTYEQAIHNAEEALSVFVETLIANGDAIPEANSIESPVSLGIMVRADLAA